MAYGKALVFFTGICSGFIMNLSKTSVSCRSVNADNTVLNWYFAEVIRKIHDKRKQFPYIYYREVCLMSIISENYKLLLRKKKTCEKISVA